MTAWLLSEARAVANPPSAFLPGTPPPAMLASHHDGPALLRRFAAAAAVVAGLLLLAVGDGQPWSQRLAAVLGVIEQ